MTNYKNLANFLFEIGFANYTQNAGWKLLGIKDDSTLSQHLFRSSVIALILAQSEGIADPYKLAFLTLVNKIYKIRTGDFHKVASSYINLSDATKGQISEEQLHLLDANVSKLFRENKSLSEEEKIIIQDAFQLDMALSAKEYLDKGNEGAGVWLDRILQVLRTKTAQEIFKSLKTTKFTDWWRDLKKAPRTEKSDYIKNI